MKYAIAVVSNGNFRIAEEGFTELANAIIRFHHICETMWNASDVETACVMVVNERLECMEGYRELIKWSNPVQA